MNKYVAFLRAVNVGGHTLLKMTDLKRMFESFGLENVQTYIQSGNVIFESGEEDAAALEKQTESQLEKAAGKKIQLFVRTIAEVRSIAEKRPFTAKENETVHVALLRQEPDRKQQASLMSFKSEADDFAVRGREIYNLRRDREQSVFSNAFIEKVLKIPVTTRNITTIQKIAEKYR